MIALILNTVIQLVQCVNILWQPPYCRTRNWCRDCGNGNHESLQPKTEDLGPLLHRQRHQWVMGCEQLPVFFCSWINGSWLPFPGENFRFRNLLTSSTNQNAHWAQSQAILAFVNCDVSQAWKYLLYVCSPTDLNVATFVCSQTRI